MLRSESQDTQGGAEKLPRSGLSVRGRTEHPHNSQSLSRGRKRFNCRSFSCSSCYVSPPRRFQDDAGDDRQPLSTRGSRSASTSGRSRLADVRPGASRARSAPARVPRGSRCSHAPHFLPPGAGPNAPRPRAPARPRRRSPTPPTTPTRARPSRRLGASRPSASAAPSSPAPARAVPTTSPSCRCRSPSPHRTIRTHLAPTTTHTPTQGSSRGIGLEFVRQLLERRDLRGRSGAPTTPSPVGLSLVSPCARPGPASVLARPRRRRARPPRGVTR